MDTAAKRPTLKEIAIEAESRLEESIQELLDNQPKLFALRVSERALAGWLFHHMLRRFFPWNVDPEYNRLTHLTKVAVVEGRDPVGGALTPDVIVHCRGFKRRNLLAIEVKLAGKPERDDRKKLKAYQHTLAYPSVAFVVFGWADLPWCAYEFFECREDPVTRKKPKLLWGRNQLPQEWVDEVYQGRPIPHWRPPRSARNRA